MKLIELKCSKCGAQLKINAELNKCMCQYCGNEMLIDNEIIHHQIDNGYQFGYQSELGRIKAQEEYNNQQEINKQIALKKENDLRAGQWISARLVALIPFFMSLLVELIIEMTETKLHIGAVILLISIIALIYDIPTTIFDKRTSLVALLLIVSLPVLSVPYSLIKSRNTICVCIYATFIGYIIGYIIGVL